MTSRELHFRSQGSVRYLYSQLAKEDRSAMTPSFHVHWHHRNKQPLFVSHEAQYCCANTVPSKTQEVKHSPSNTALPSDSWLVLNQISFTEEHQESQKDILFMKERTRWLAGMQNWDPTCQLDSRAHLINRITFYWQYFTQKSSSVAVTRAPWNSLFLGPCTCQPTFRLAPTGKLGEFRLILPKMPLGARSQEPGWWLTQRNSQ